MYWDPGQYWPFWVNFLRCAVYLCIKKFQWLEQSGPEDLWKLLTTKLQCGGDSNRRRIQIEPKKENRRKKMKGMVQVKVRERMGQSREGMSRPEKQLKGEIKSQEVRKAMRENLFPLSMSNRKGLLPNSIQIIIRKQRINSLQSMKRSQKDMTIKKDENCNLVFPNKWKGTLKR